MRVHGLRAADLAGAPPLDAVLDDLVGLLADRVLVAHAAWVERAFLARALRPRGLRLGRAVVDTAGLARACGLADPRAEHEPALETTARRLGLPVHTPHHALGDAFTTAEVFLALATRLEGPDRERAPLTVRRLRSLSRHRRG
jgi:DNA polymerase-3 subunit epsilon